MDRDAVHLACAQIFLFGELILWKAAACRGSLIKGGGLGFRRTIHRTAPERPLMHIDVGGSSRLRIVQKKADHLWLCRACSRQKLPRFGIDAAVAIAMNVTHGPEVCDVTVTLDD